MPEANITLISVDSVPVMRLENDLLRVDICPSIGGRVLSIVNRGLEREFLWRNERLTLRPSQPGDPYDPNFYGGIDEVIPGDIPETIYGLDCPDHGELWTMALDAQREGGALRLTGTLPRWGLRYEKRVTLRSGTPWIDIDYRIENMTGERRVFLWKLHAAVQIEAGDAIVCPAQTAAAADPQWSRWGTDAPFSWPMVDDQRRADVIPPEDGTTDFLFLYNLEAGWVGLRRSGCELGIAFDRQVFPYVCCFASYGGFFGHYTAILEPATAMPLSVVEADRLDQCSSLAPGELLETRVSIYAGPQLESKKR